jgi:L-ascorbate metabolism protein UlaG (beta-lactamase superfamily)
LKPENIINKGSGYIVGGGAVLPWVKIVAVPALHTSRTSVPIGTIIMNDGTTIYHAGDTAITAEMEIFARLYPIDIAMLPIFGIATMDYIHASEAVRLMKPKIVMPIHFDFCESPEKTLNAFIERCKKQNSNVTIIKTELDKYYSLED